MSVREYIGARYVPLFMGDWDNTKTYEPLSIVQHEGNSYTSRQFVPTGIDIDNDEYWAETGNFNAQVEAYRQEVLAYKNEIDNIFFDTVSDMKASQDLAIGSIVETAGYFNANDGGSAKYIIASTGSPNDIDVIACGSVFAVLVAEKNNILQFGINPADPSRNATVCNYVFSSGYNVEFLGEIPIDSLLVLSSNKIRQFDFHNAVFKAAGSNIIPTMFEITDYANFETNLDSLYLDCDSKANTAIMVTGRNVNIINCTIKNHNETAIHFTQQVSMHNTICNVFIWGNSASNSNGIVLDCLDCIIDDCTIFFVENAIVMNGAGHFVSNCHFWSGYGSSGYSDTSKGIVIASNGFYKVNAVYFDAYNTGIYTQDGISGFVNANDCVSLFPETSSDSSTYQYDNPCFARAANNSFQIDSLHFAPTSKDYQILRKSSSITLFDRNNRISNCIHVRNTAGADVFNDALSYSDENTLELIQSSKALTNGSWYLAGYIVPVQNIINVISVNGKIRFTSNRYSTPAIADINIALEYNASSQTFTDYSVIEKIRKTSAFDVVIGGFVDVSNGEVTYKALPVFIKATQSVTIGNMLIELNMPYLRSNFFNIVDSSAPTTVAATFDLS